MNFPKNKLSGGQEQEQVFLVMEFNGQVSTFLKTEVAIVSVGRNKNKIVLTCCLGYYGKKSIRPRALLSDSPAIISSSLVP